MTVTVTVVVADGAELMRESLARVLEGEEIEVVAQAATGEQALAMTLELEPDVVVVDAQIPSIGGIELVSRLRLDCHGAKVIVMAADEAPGLLLDAIAAGAEGYLLRSATGAELREAVLVTHAGGSVIAPVLARALMAEFADSARSAPCAPRPVSREVEILRLLVQGMSHDEIGQALFISPLAVRHHLAKIRAATSRRPRPDDDPPPEGGASGGVREPRRDPPDGGSACSALRLDDL